MKALRITIMPNPPQRGITDYKDDEEAIVDALRHNLRSLEFIAGDSRYSCGADRRGYEARIARIKRILEAL